MCSVQLDRVLVVCKKQLQNARLFCFILHPVIKIKSRFIQLTVLCLFDKHGLQFHRANTVNLAVDVMIAFNQTDVFYFRTDFDH